MLLGNVGSEPLSGWAAGAVGVGASCNDIDEDLVGGEVELDVLGPDRAGAAFG